MEFGISEATQSMPLLCWIPKLRLALPCSLWELFQALSCRFWKLRQALSCSCLNLRIQVKLPGVHPPEVPHW
eukprot:g17054.t1